MTVALILNNIVGSQNGMFYCFEALWPRLFGAFQEDFSVMYAVIKTSGRQWTVKEGDVITVNRVAAKAGESVTFDEVLLVGGTKVTIGAPFLKGAKVTGTVTDHLAGDKITIFKYKRRKNYKRTQGHKQALTSIKINTISI